MILCNICYWFIVIVIINTFCIIILFNFIKLIIIFIKVIIKKYKLGVSELLKDVKFLILQ